MKRTMKRTILDWLIKNQWKVLVVICAVGLVIGFLLGKFLDTL